MHNLEPGLHFHPDDEELLLLLEKKNKGERHRSDFVMEKDIYGSESPWELFKDTDPWEKESVDYERKEKKLLHVFTKLSYLSPKRIKRSSGCGTWSGKNKGKPITNIKGEILGLKKSFKFASKSPISEMQGHWNMYEYSSLAGKKTDYVICKIIRTRPKSTNMEEDVVPSSAEFSLRSSVPIDLTVPDDEAQTQASDEFHLLLQSFQERPYELYQLSTTQELQNSCVYSQGNQLISATPTSSSNSVQETLEGLEFSQSVLIDPDDSAHP